MSKQISSMTTISVVSAPDVVGSKSRERGEEPSRCLQGHQERYEGHCSEKCRGPGTVVLVPRRRSGESVGRVPEYWWSRVSFLQSLDAVTKKSSSTFVTRWETRQMVMLM